jgi:polyvinyl alcohol dehydrogenase (cytochrome)
MRTASRFVAGLAACSLLLLGNRLSLVADRPDTAAAAAQELPTSSPGQVIFRARCAACHDAAAGSPEATRAPSRDALRARSRESIVAALSAGGSMAPMATGITAIEKEAIAAFLSPIIEPPVDAAAGRCATQPATLPDPARLPRWNGWGNDSGNARFQPSAGAGLTARTVPRLTLKWAFGIPGAISVSAQPTVYAGRVFLGTESGTVYALDANTGCVYWQFKAAGGVRSAISVGPLAGTTPLRYAAYFGDFRANVYAVDARTGEQIWSLKVDDHAWARVTGAPALSGGRLYVPVSSIEEVPGARPEYPCCTFRGSVVAIDASSGARIWKTYTIADAPRMTGTNAAGTPLWEPAGAAIWSAPTVDVPRKVLYVATGNGYTAPAAPSTDAVIAMSLESGAIQWVSQVTPRDSYVIGCRTDNDNCPDDVGPDFDFGNSPILRKLTNGRSVLAIGQKSGVAYGMDPDRKGAVVWQYRAGTGGPLGGIEWGAAADERIMYVPVSDVLASQPGGLHAIGLGSGERIWHTPAPAPACSGGLGCSGAQSAAVSVIPGVVFSGSVDGHLRAYDTGDGRIIWDFDTTRDFDTVNGVRGSGGSIDGGGPVIAGGMVFAGSGYGRWRGRPGNVLLAFAVQ